MAVLRLGGIRRRSLCLDDRRAGHDVQAEQPALCARDVLEQGTRPRPGRDRLRAQVRGRSCLRPLRWLVLVLLCGLVTVPAATTAWAPVYRIDHVVDGDTVDLTNGAKV